MFKSRILIIVLILLCSVVWVCVFQNLRRVLRIVFFDVGEGEAALIHFPYGGVMLVDGGEVGKGDRAILDYLRKEGLRKLDTVILTNGSPGHLGGLIEIVKSLQVRLLLTSETEIEEETYQQFLELVAERKIHHDTIHRGDRINGYRAVSIEFLNPPYPLLNRYSGMNNNSIVLKLTYGDIGFLFCSDMRHEAEKEMVNFYRNKLESDVIKFPSHSRGVSSSADFLEAVKPAILVISGVAETAADYPHCFAVKKLDSQELRTSPSIKPVPDRFRNTGFWQQKLDTLAGDKKYEDGGCLIYDTRKSGAITISTDGTTINVHTQIDTGKSF